MDEKLLAKLIDIVDNQRDLISSNQAIAKQLAIANQLKAIEMKIKYPGYLMAIDEIIES